MNSHLLLFLLELYFVFFRQRMHEQAQKKSISVSEYKSFFCHGEEVSCVHRVNVPDLHFRDFQASLAVTADDE